MRRSPVRTPLSDGRQRLPHRTSVLTEHHSGGQGAQGDEGAGGDHPHQRHADGQRLH